MATEPDEVARFRAIVEELVAGALRDSIAQTDRPPERFVEEAVESESTITAEVAQQRETVDGLRRRKRATSRALWWRVLFAVAAVSIGAVTASAVAPSLSSWFLIANGLGLVLALAASFITAAASRRELGDRIESAETHHETALKRAIQGWLAERANRALGEIYSTSLPDLDPEGLAEIDDSEREIPTETASELESLIERMPGGSVGISGPRGAGKTTLLRRITTDAWRRRPDEVAVGVVVDAPVDYDAREFVLHLFARLCEVILGPDRVDALRGWDRGVAAPPPLRTLGLMRGPLSRRLGPLLCLGGVVLYIAVLDAQGELHLSALAPLALFSIALGVIVTYLTYLPSMLDPRALIRRLRMLLIAGPEEEGLAEAAEQRLRQIWFQRTHSRSWSGGLKLPVGIEAGGERSTQMAENQLSFPDVVGLYKEFVEGLAEGGQVRIGIDELDKMDDERARRFLNEIKVIFRISGCFYLVSVSEDAMSYFERRGLPFRDVFDSSFDDVRRVGYLPYKDSHRMLRRRVVGMPIQFVALCHILGGGLARDVIRAARDVCEREPEVSIDEVTGELCTRQLRSKCAAAQVAMRRLKDPSHVMLLSRWLRGIDIAATDLATLLEMCEAFGEEFVSGLGPPPAGDPEALIEHREALSIALEVITFAYFVVTVREYLPSLDTEAATKAAIANSALDRLAQARQAFAVNPGEAWEAVSFVRADYLRAAAVDFPSLREPAALG